MNATAISGCQLPDWLTLNQIAAALNRSRRSVQRRLENVPADLKRSVRQEIGRPMVVYHRTALPEMQNAECRMQNSTIKNNPAEKSGISATGSFRSFRASGCARGAENLLAEQSKINASDLALGQLRAEAVLAYEGLKDRLGEAAAAEAICAAYAREPKRSKVEIVERIHDNHVRRLDRMIICGGFSPRTLRRWAQQYQVGGRTPLALAPEMRGKVGRKGKAGAIQDTLVDLVHAWTIKNPRSNLIFGLEAARKEWPGDFPDVSYSTWQRILRRRDSSGAMATLGKHGISSFRQNHSPVIDRDYSEMAYNALWEIDDVTLDFYGYNWNYTQLVRPHAYAVIRVATREWIAVVTTETPITQDQVRSLLGMAFISPNGGLPDAIRFERGTVACDDYLRDLLATLGVKAHNTSMDGGKTHAGAFQDRAKGHFQGKGIIERAIRELHGIMWDNLLQVGTMERDSAPANHETMKREIIALANGGKIIPKLTPHHWMAATSAALEEYNDRPHGGLPKIVDGEKSSQETGQVKYRHMTPHECGRAKLAANGCVKVMDEKLLPLFIQRGYKVLVNKNGFTLNNFSYGRFDADIQARAGTSVLVYAIPEFPKLAFVQELGRCVEAWKMPKAGAEGEYIETKRGIEAKARNKYQELMLRVMQAGSQAVIDQTKILASAIPIEMVEKVNPPTLVERMQAMERQREFHRAKDKELDARLSFPRSGERAAVAAARIERDRVLAAISEGSAGLVSEGRGLAAALADKAAELEALQDLK